MLSVALTVVCNYVYCLLRCQLCSQRHKVHKFTRLWNTDLCDLCLKLNYMQHSFIEHFMVSMYVVWWGYGEVWCCVMWCGVVWDSMVRCGVVRFGMVWGGGMLCSLVWYMCVCVQECFGFFLNS